MRGGSVFDFLIIFQKNLDEQLNIVQRDNIDAKSAVYFCSHLRAHDRAVLSKYSSRIRCYVIYTGDFDTRAPHTFIDELLGERLANVVLVHVPVLGWPNSLARDMPFRDGRVVDTPDDHLLQRVPLRVRVDDACRVNLGRGRHVVVPVVVIKRFNSR